MADRELGNILNSGEIGSIFLGGIQSSNSVLQRSEIDAKIDVVDNKIDELAVQSSVEVALGIDIDTLVEVRVYEVDTNTPEGSGTLNVSRYSNAPQPNLVKQHYKNTLGKDYTRTAPDFNNPVWTAWVQDTSYADSADVISFAENTTTLVEGQLSYNSDDKSLNFKSDIADQTLNIGQEVVVRVYNGTGSTIPNGSACRIIGTQAGRPSIGLAQANSFHTAMVLGISTHEIPHGTEGYITLRGRVQDISTESGWNAGEMLWLSETVAGGYTTTMPDITTVAGILLTNNGTTGSMFAVPSSLVSLPPVSGRMKDISANIEPNSSYQTFVNYTNELSSAGLSLDPVLGSYSITVNGTYSVTLNISLTGITTSGGTKVIAIDVYNQTTAQIISSTNIVADNEYGAGIVVDDAALNSGDVLVARYREVSGNTGNNVDIENITFIVNSILIR